MEERIVKSLCPLPANSRLVIFGGGFSGQHVAKIARQLGAKVFCSRRTSKKDGADFIFNSITNELPEFNVLRNATHVLSCIPPSANGNDPVLTHFTKELRDAPLQWVGYLSTTGVYGDSQGKWVNEEDEVNPKQPRSIRRLACEEEWRKSNLPIQILRLPGIYGPGRSAIETISSGKAKMIEKPGQVFSRVHIDDIAGAALFLMNLARKGIHPKIVNIADDLPCSNLEVLSFAAKLIGKSLPPVQSFEKASKEMSPMAISFWEENRRIENKLLCENLGYSLIHSDYRSGLLGCLQNRSIKVNTIN